MFNSAEEVTPETAEQIRQTVRKYLRETDCTQQELGRAIGYTAGVISGALKGTYPGDERQVLFQLNNLIEQRVKQDAAPKTTDFVYTNIATRIKTLIDNVIEHRAIGIMFGPGGIGKSMTLETLAPIYGALYHYVNDTEITHGQLVGGLCREMRISRKGPIPEQFHRLVGTLQGSRRLLIFDEAHKLKPRARELLRSLHDRTGCPMVLSGVSSLLEGALDDATEDRGQWAGRVLFRWDLTEAFRNKPHRPLYTAGQIRQICTNAGLQLTQDGIDTAMRIAHSLGQGGLRLMLRVASIARKMAAHLGADKIGSNHMWAAFRATRTTTEVETVRIQAEAVKVAG